MGRSVQASVKSVCVCVCVLGRGVNVIANLLMSPKACPPMRQTLTDAAVTMGHLCHCQPEGHLEGWRGVNLLAVWSMGPQLCSFSDDSENKVIKKNVLITNK